MNIYLYTTPSMASPSSQLSSQQSHTLRTHSSRTTFMEPQCAIQPRSLKDFLQDQNLYFPRHRKSTFSVFIRAAVSSVKSSSKLRRSISRRFSTKSRALPRLPEPTVSRTTSVTVKDILRWKSFRDLADPVENNVLPPSDYAGESPSRRTTTSAGTPRSSWGDSDFTAGDSPVWCGEIEVAGKKNFHINVAGGERLHQNTGDLKNPIIHEEDDEQFSPISVLDFTQQHEETFSSFHQSLANMERRNLMLKQRIKDFENLIEVEDRCLANINENIELNDIESFKIEEKAIQLMDRVKTTSFINKWDVNMEYMLLDYFRNELITSKNVKNENEFESEVLMVAKSWVKDENGEVEGAQEFCFRGMEKSGNWKEFEDEKQEFGIEIEKIMLNYLLDELLIDLLNV